MTWSPADDYDDQGRYTNPLRPRPRYRRHRECQPGCCWIGTRLCDPPEHHDEEGDTND